MDNPYYEDDIKERKAKDARLAELEKLVVEQEDEIQALKEELHWKKLRISSLKKFGCRPSLED